MKMQKFLSWYKPYRGLLAADLGCSALTAALALALPLCVRHITRDILEAGLDGAAPAILQTGALMLALILLQTAAAFFYDYKGHDMGAKIERDMRMALFSHVQRFSPGFFDQRRIGDLMSRLTNDLNGLAELYHHGPENVFVHGVSFVGAVVILFTVNPRLTLIVCAVLPLMAVYSFVFYKRLQSVYLENRARITDINARAEENISGIRDVKSFAAEPYEVKRFETLNQRFYQSRARIYRHEALHYTIIDKCLAPLITVAAVVFGGLWMDGGLLSAADLITFIMYIAYLTGPIPQLAFMVQQYQDGMSGYRRFCEIMDAEPEIRDAADAVTLPRVKGRVTFEHVTFKYDGEQPYVLHNINLDIRPGEKLAVAGRSGAGKTTLCALVPRFYEVLEGAVRIDGYDVRDVRLDSLRKQIGVVRQDYFLFAGTVMENILFGRPEATEAEAVEAAQKANAHEFIEKLPNGYQTEIGERGVRLSGGQKQRLCIARVFLKNPPVIIFDEATASLDYESERIVMESLDALAKGRTTLIIAHRLSTVRRADRIVVLTEQGIAEQGSHEELLAQNGEYALLYKAGGGD